MSVTSLHGPYLKPVAIWSINIFPLGLEDCKFNKSTSWLSGLSSKLNPLISRQQPTRYDGTRARLVDLEKVPNGLKSKLMAVGTVSVTYSEKGQLNFQK